MTGSVLCAGLKKTSLKQKDKRLVPTVPAVSAVPTAETAGTVETVETVILYLE